MWSVSTQGDELEIVQIQQPISTEEGLCIISHCDLLPGLAFPVSSSTKFSMGRAGKFKLQMSSSQEQEDAVENSPLSKVSTLFLLPSSLYLVALE